MILFLRIHLRRFFFVSFLLFLLSQKKKQEKPDGKRKKKKGFLGLACRLIKFPCVKRGEFYLLSCVTCGHSSSANSAGPNHSLRIRWFEVVGYTVPVRYKKQYCSAIVFVVILLGDPIPFPQSSSKTMVFSHCFPEFSLVGPATFLKGAGGSLSKGFPKRFPLFLTSSRKARPTWRTPGNGR